MKSIMLVIVFVLALPLMAYPWSGAGGTSSSGQGNPGAAARAAQPSYSAIFKEIRTMIRDSKTVDDIKYTQAYLRNQDVSSKRELDELVKLMEHRLNEITHEEPSYKINRHNGMRIDEK